ncbi:MAG: NIPSNAP family protein [Chloroflexi bacterium]|nr:NIPSNAP family protein [Chloroflexota bacterium]
MTIAHLRTYTINKGMMDSWLSSFDKLIPLMSEHGITVESAWVNAEGTQFIWIRSYGDAVENIEKAEAGFYGSEYWVANVDDIRSHIAHREIVQIESI